MDAPWCSVACFGRKAGRVPADHTAGEREEIGITPNHPIWSEDRQAFVPAGALRAGEQLRSLFHEQVRVVSIAPRAPPQYVYNLEVAGEHVYAVSDLGALAHNACGDYKVCVYRENDEIKYVGQTMRELAQRQALHRRIPGREHWKLETIKEGLTKEEATALEEAIITALGTARRGGQLYNKNHVISPERRKQEYRAALELGLRLLKEEDLFRTIGLNEDHLRKLQEIIDGLARP